MYDEQLKTCTSCQDIKPVAEFHVSARRPNGTIVYQPRCKVCYNKHYATKWHVMDEAAKSREKSRRKETYNSDWFKNYRLTTKYGITLDQFSEMYERQHGSCAICGTSVDVDKIHVDHNHTTGKVRKLLCQSCNVILGHAKEDINILNNAIAYLKDHGDIL